MKNPQQLHLNPINAHMEYYIRQIQNTSPGVYGTSPSKVNYTLSNKANPNVTTKNSLQCVFYPQ
jgi:hypothetical protein